MVIPTSGVPRNFVRGGGGIQQIQLRTENEDLGAVASYPLVKSSGGSCDLVQDISFHILSFLIFDTLRQFMMTTNLFVITNVKQLRTSGSFRILLSFFFEHLGVLAS